MTNQELLRKLEESHSMQAQAILSLRDAIRYDKEFTSEAKEIRENLIVDRVVESGTRNVFSQWEVGKAYKEGEVVEFQGNIYKVLQDHESQLDWRPDEAVSLYVKVVPEGVIPEWQQPTGSHDAYNTGDKVTYEGKIYESLIDANTWSPSEYPQGWEEVEE